MRVVLFFSFVVGTLSSRSVLGPHLVGVENPNDVNPNAAIPPFTIDRTRSQVGNPTLYPFCDSTLTTDEQVVAVSDFPKVKIK
jgi:hypothetical protein